MRYLLAVSGGRDSMALLDWMAKRYPAEELTVAHFNHRQRGKGSDADERFVARAAKKRGVRFVSARGDARKKSENALREERWAFLRGVGAATIVTAHTLDDQLETFLMRLLRGTGLDGLPGMRKRENGIWRPFLGKRRLELPKVKFREDESNASLEFFRNRVRHELVPAMKKLAPGGGDSFLRKFSSLQRELLWTRSLVRSREKRLLRALVVDTGLWRRVEEKRWRELSPDWQRRALRSLASGLTRAEVERARRALKVSRRGEIGRGYYFQVSCGQIYFRHREEGEPQLEVIPGENSYRVRCRELGFEAEVSHELQGTWRFFRDGDRWEERKLKEVLLTRRIPAPERRLLPLVVSQTTSSVKWFFSQENPYVRILRADFPYTF